MLAAALNAPQHPSFDTEPSVAAPAGAPAAAPAAAAPAAEFDENNSYKVYIVLHGQGIRASPESSDIGYVHTGTRSGETAPNFFQVPQKTRVFRMVPPGHVFMSHEDINKELRTFFGKNISKWIQTFKSSTTLSVNAKQAAALKDHSSVDPETTTYNRSRAIFNKMLQLFITGDEITNERLETDYDTPEAIREFGIWIASPDAPHAFSRLPLYSATDPRFLNSAGKAKEVPLGSMIDNIRKTYGEDNSFEFYVANCSPVSQDMSAKKRLVRKNNGKWSRDGEYSTVPNSIDFWKNTLTMYNKRISLYHNGNARLEQLKDRTRRHASRTVLKFPDTDTVWGMMDDEERKDNYKLMNGFLHFYPKWIEAASTSAEKQKIRDDMIFYIKCISTPFVEQIRGSPPGFDHIQGISQVTKVNIPIYGYKNKTTRNKKTGRRKTRKVRYKVSERKVYYTLSDELIKKLAAKINLCRRRKTADDLRAIPLYCDLLDHIYGQHPGEETGYKAGMPQRILACESGASAPVIFSFSGGARRKRRRKTRKKRRRKRKKTRRRKSK